MRVLIVHPQMALYGGAEVVIVKLAKYLEAHGHKASVLTLTTNKCKDYDGLDIITSPFEDEQIQWRPRTGSLDTLKELYKIYSVLKSLVRERIGDYDVVNTHNFPSLWAIPNNSNVVHQCNEIPDLWHNQQIPKLVNPLLNVGRLGDRIISNRKNAVSVVSDERMAQIFQHRYNRKPQIVPYGVDSEFWGDKSVVVNRNEKRFTVIVPSMVTPSKRQLEVLYAVNKLRKRFEGISALFVGYKDESSQYMILIRQYIKDNGLEDCVNFTGLVSREVLRECYKLSDVAVIAGSGQGSWLGGFEALATGTPIIVSPQLTCSTLVESERLGIVSDDFTESIKKEYLLHEHYKKQSVWQADWVKKNLTWDNYCESMTNIMEEKCSNI